jgi:hypothetical protein
MLGHAGELAIPITKTKEGAAGGAVQYAIAASTTGERWCLDWATISIDTGNAAIETFTITVGSTIVFNIDLPIAVELALVQHHFAFPHGIWSGVNEAITLDLSTLSGAEVGNISLGYR